MAIEKPVDFYRDKTLTPPGIVDNHFISVPSTPGTNGIISLLGNAKDLEVYKNRYKQINHNTSIEIKADKKSRAIITKNENTEFIVELEDIDKFIGINKGFKKIFVYILYKLSKQQITENLFEDKTIEFNLQELVNIGLYKNMDTARVGFKNIVHELTSLKVEGRIKDKNTMKNIGEGISVLFPNAFILNGTCVITLNKSINWPVFALLYFAPLPTTYFSLPINASDLEYYIFTQARMKKRELLDKGCFTIKLRTIQQALGLIDEKKTKSPTDKIKKPILEAIETVVKAENNPDFDITVTYDKNGTIKDFLDNGFITVFMKGNYSQKIINIAENQEAKIQAMINKKEKIATQAQALALADKIKADN